MERYLYLIYSGLFLTMLVILLLVRKDLRPAAIPCIILGAIANPINELLYFRDYWRPLDLMGRGKVSIEDVIFGGSTYGLAMLCYAFFLHKGISYRTTKFRPRFRAVVILAMTTVIMVILNLGLGINSVIAFIATTTCFWGYMVLRRHDLIVPSLIGGLICMAGITCGYIVGLDYLEPHILNSWWLLQGTPLGTTVFGKVPLTELGWFASLTCFVPTLYFYSTGRAYVTLPATQKVLDGRKVEPIDQLQHASAQTSHASEQY